MLLKDKATEIANEVSKSTGNEGEAIATGLKPSRGHSLTKHPQKCSSHKYIRNGNQLIAAPLPGVILGCFIPVLLRRGN
jgi:hypothetical protein